MKKYLLFLIAISFFLNYCDLKSTTIKQNKKMDNHDTIKRLINEALKSSRVYYSIDALPQKDSLTVLVKKYDQLELNKFTPIEQFFLVEIAPETKKQMSEEELAKAYCIALSYLVGNWWGRPGTVDTEVSQHLMKISPKEIQNCLVELLDNRELLEYYGSEISTLSKMLNWSVSDLAAGFLSKMLKVDFDDRADVKERELRKQQIKKIEN